MPKKGGKKHNKKKGAGGGGAKIPDVKNVISPGHKEEDKLLYGEGTAAEATTAEATTASGSTAPVAATAPETQEALAQDIAQTGPSAAVPGKEQELPVREKDIVSTEATKEQRGDERTEALAAAAPTGSKKKAEQKDAETVLAPKETTIAEPVLERSTSSRSTERADLVPATKGKPEPAVAPATTGVSEALPSATEKDQIPAEEPAGLAAAGATVLTGENTTGEGRAQPGLASVETTEVAREAHAHPAEKPQDTEVATAAPLVAPHIKRSHEVPLFVTEERDQPSKKPRVDESAEPQQKVSVPGGYPSPSVEGSTASGTDSAIASEAQNISKGETVADKPETAGTVTATPRTEATGTKGSTEAAVAAPAAVPVTTQDTKAEKTSTTDTGPGAGSGTALSSASPAGEISAQKEPVLPVTPQKVDTTAKPTSPAAAAAAAAAFRTQPTKQQQEATATNGSEEVTPSKPAQQAPAQKEAKKGGFMAWIKRRFKGEKSTTATANGNSH